MKRLRILLVDDHQVVRLGVRALIDDQPGMTVVGEAGTVREAVKRTETNPPLKELIEKGVTPYGMQTFEMAVRQLLTDGKITKELAQSQLEP